MKIMKHCKSLMALCLSCMMLMSMTTTAFAYTDSTVDTTDAVVEEVVIPEETPAEPLTPDGNAALADDMNYGDKQLITVTTKSGNYFYILIDRGNEDEESCVHFLNQVDEADLMALMDDDQKAALDTGAIPEETPAVTETVTPEPDTSVIEEPDEPEEPQEKEQNSPIGMILLIALAVAALAICCFIRKRSRDDSEDDSEDETAYGGEEQPDDADEELPDDIPEKEDSAESSVLADGCVPFDTDESEEDRYPDPNNYPSGN